eukprot:gene28885-32077_t
MSMCWIRRTCSLATSPDNKKKHKQKRGQRVESSGSDADDEDAGTENARGPRSLPLSGGVDLGDEGVGRGQDGAHPAGLRGGMLTRRVSSMFGSGAGSDAGSSVGSAAGGVDGGPTSGDEVKNHPTTIICPFESFVTLERKDVARGSGAQESP